ncbi:MAG: (2Fe-2S)-binding protein [Tannerella sp.]|jgi:ferredoxin|nr:(2Fe-2S)-binding protein [Tannerella sp.]
MQITVNGKLTATLEGETVIEVLRRLGISTPALCYAKGMKHKSSCMVCVVKECNTGQIIPSCTTAPTEGMCIETDSEEVRAIRSMSLELLLSDHRADCEAPCSIVCPHGLDVERMLWFYDRMRQAEAFALLSAAFALPHIACDDCKAPCEKACRRGTVDSPVSIRAIIKQIVATTPAVETEHAPSHQQSQTEDAPSYQQSQTEHAPSLQKSQTDNRKNLFLSRLGRFSEDESAYLRASVATPSRCLHCACEGQQACKLRRFATEAGIKRPRYEASSALHAARKIHINGDLWFDEAKCIRCGLCVYNTVNGFTFRNRGFVMQVVIPDENKPDIPHSIAELCPTGAIYKLSSTGEASSQSG